MTCQLGARAHPAARMAPRAVALKEVPRIGDLFNAAAVVM